MDILPIAYSPIQYLHNNIVRINKPPKKNKITGIRYIKQN